jgi:tryptophan-rich sensory protein
MEFIGMVEARDATNRPGRVAVGFLAAAPVLIAGVLGNLATMPNLAPRYAGLAKPPFGP